MIEIKVLRFCVLSHSHWSGGIFSLSASLSLSPMYFNVLSSVRFLVSKSIGTSDFYGDDLNSVLDQGLRVEDYLGGEGFLCILFSWFLSIHSIWSRSFYVGLSGLVFYAGSTSTGTARS